MNRVTITFPVENISVEKLLNWAKRYDVFTLLNSNSHSNNQTDNYSNFDVLLAVDPVEIFMYEDLFHALKFISDSNDWYILHLSYDLKNKIETLSSTNPDKINFPEFIIYRPAVVFEIREKKLFVHYIQEKYSPEEINLFIEQIKVQEPDQSTKGTEIRIDQRLSRDEYISEINEIKKHIQRGDIYEMNYCQEFYSEHATIDPFQTYLDLNEISPMPFSVFSKYNEHFLMCASPERYLAKRGQKIISQPIKGTARRDSNPEEDKLIAERLFHDEKERSENVMIVDLVRNDLGRIAERGSVRVDELCAIYSFPRIHQMISTVSSQLKKNVRFTDILKATFPMGSMTGAPKIRAMQIIDEQELFRRGIYSGSVGYIDPNGDFDFNVVIRSIIADEQRNEIYFPAGSAITVHCDPKAEFNECLLKARGMQDALQE